MSEERLDRIEAGLDETRKIVDSNARAILALTDQGVELNKKMDRLSTELNDKMDRLSTELNGKLDRTSAIVAELASIVFDTTARQQDHENRINRIEQE